MRIKSLTHELGQKKKSSCNSNMITIDSKNLTETPKILPLSHKLPKTLEAKPIQTWPSPSSSATSQRRRRQSTPTSDPSPTHNSTQNSNWKHLTNPSLHHLHPPKTPTFPSLLLLLKPHHHRFLLHPPQLLTARKKHRQ